MLGRARGLVAVTCLLLLWQAGEHYRATSVARLRVLGPPPTNLIDEEEFMTISWQHTPEGSSGPTTITITQRVAETDDAFDLRYQAALTRYPADPE